MLSENTVKKILEHGLKQGADFTEVFVEDTVSSSINLLDQKIDEIISSNSFGIGVRLLYGNEAYYGYSSDSEEGNLLKLTENLGQSVMDGQSGSIQPLENQSVEDIHHVAINPDTVSKSERAELLRNLDKITRSHGQDICQVNANMAEKKRSVLIANSEGLWSEDTRSYSRMRLSAVAEKGDGPQSAAESPGVLGGYEFFKNLDLEELAENAAQSALRMASAGYINGGILPVVLGNGFGGVIFHEACGHPLETEAIRKNASPFCDKIGMEVGQPILTAIDDGTIPKKMGLMQC